jgi:O-antigen/teichoic acid export membrane protein
LKDLTTIGAVDIISAAIGAVFWFYIASILGAEQYGQVSYLIAIGGMASSIALLGSENTLTVYTAKNIRLQSAIYAISLITSAISGIILFLILDKVEVSFLVIGYVIFGLAISEMLGRKAYVSYSKYMIANKILMVGLSIAFYHIYGANGIILGIASSSFLYLISIVKGFRTTKIDFSLVRTRVGFMMTSYMTNLSDRFISSLDKLIIAPLLGFVVLGNYQLGLQFLEVFLIVTSIVFKYILPHDASGNPNYKLKKLTILFSAGITPPIILLTPLVIPWLFPQYTASVQVIQLLSFSLVPATINMVYASKFLGSERNRIILYSSLIFLVVQTVGIILLGGILGANGAAVGFNIGVVSQTIFYFLADRLRGKRT